MFKIGVSDLVYEDRRKWDKDNNWFDFLRNAGLSVATWSQPGRTFNQAYASVDEAFEKFLAATDPAPVALLGHSRGGLLIRKLLKEKGGGGRVRWVITLHSPHDGTELARAPGEIGAEAVDLIGLLDPAQLLSPLKKELKRVVTELLRPLTRWIMDDRRRELVPDGPLLRDLASGESALANVEYYTFGGVSPTYFRVYLWFFDAMSAVPQYVVRYRKVHGVRVPSSVRQYFVWRVAPSELHGVSPLLDRVRDFVPEVKPGYGDGLVADARSRLPFAEHITNRLNHGEALHDRDLMEQVRRLLRPSVLEVATRVDPR